MQRNPALAVELGAAHFCTTETTRHLDSNTLNRRGALGTLQALAHCTTECDASAELLRDPLCHELGLGLGVLDLENIELDLLARELLEVRANSLGLCASSTDHDARTGGVDVDANAVAGALDFDAGNAGTIERRLQQVADLDVFGDEVAVALSDLRAV